MNDTELFETLTKNPAEKWRQKNIGSILRNNNADVVIAKNFVNKGFDAFYSINPENILLVLHKGEIRIFDKEIKDQLLANQFPISQFSKIIVNGKCKYVYGNLPGLIRKVKDYYPEVDFPVDV
jgi:hypothetical protein